MLSSRTVVVHASHHAILSALSNLKQRRSMSARGINIVSNLLLDIGRETLSLREFLSFSLGTLLGLCVGASLAVTVMAASDDLFKATSSSSRGFS